MADWGKKTWEFLKTAGTLVGAVAVVASAVGALLSAVGDDSENLMLPGTTDLRSKYTRDWLNTASLDELETERLKVYSIFANLDPNVPSYYDTFNLLNEFDEAIEQKQIYG